MKKLVLFLSLLLLPLSGYADENIGKIFKVESYDLEDLSDSYYNTQYGSAVYMEDGLLYTNAHVVLDENDEPIGNYRVCETIDFKKAPRCFSVGELLYYDTKNDLAALKISNSKASPVIKSKKELNIGDSVRVYGYPSNGGETISYTEGKISGFENGLYKTDANLDAGNSGGGVFDSEGNLIGIAVSVTVGYTTMGYVIPMSEIYDFKNKINKNSIEEYSEKVDEKFKSYVSLVNKVVGSSSFSSGELILNRLFRKYNFEITDYFVDNNNKFNILNLEDSKRETDIEIYNINYSGKKDLDINTLYLRTEESSKKSKDDGDIEAYKVRKFKFKGRNTILSFAKGEKGNVALQLIIEVGKNNYQSLMVSSDNMKNKSFINGLRVMIQYITLKDVEYGDNSLAYMTMDNLKILKQDGFYISNTFGGESLINYGGDIEVGLSRTSSLKYEYYEDYTLSSYTKKLLSYTKDYIYYNHFGLKETKDGEKYIYSLLKNNQYVGGAEDKKSKKYAINAYFFDTKDDEEFYQNTFSFSFDDVSSKKEIDDLLYNIKTKNAELPFDEGDLKVGENLIEEDGFDFE